MRGLQITEAWLTGLLCWSHTNPLPPRLHPPQPQPWLKIGFDLFMTWPQTQLWSNSSTWSHGIPVFECGGFPFESQSMALFQRPKKTGAVAFSFPWWHWSRCWFTCFIPWWLSRRRRQFPVIEYNLSNIYTYIIYLYNYAPYYMCACYVMYIEHKYNITSSSLSHTHTHIYIYINTCFLVCALRLLEAMLLLFFYAWNMPVVHVCSYAAKRPLKGQFILGTYATAFRLKKQDVSNPWYLYVWCPYVRTMLFSSTEWKNQVFDNVFSCPTMDCQRNWMHCRDVWRQFYDV